MQNPVALSLITLLFLIKILEKQRLKNRAGITKYQKDEEPFYHE
jgi:hypothetical protein